MNGRISVEHMDNGKYTTMMYDARGQKTTMLTSSRQTVTSTFDSVGNLIEKVTRNPFSSTTRQWTVYDLNGNPTAESSVHGYLRTFTYDELDRVVETNASGVSNFTHTMSYDEVGNRTYSNEQGPAVFQYNLAGEITSMDRQGNQVTHTYDSNGNLQVVSGRLYVANPGTVTMSYDKENRQISHTQGATVVTYTYSGDGLKRSEIASGSTTTLVWDGSEYIGETN
ncbi:MAG: hypothetical protein KF824_06870 [Fimbriimonadaceae bacterium]|nr:MAG: hypothetical protein KF824_06870 [Fimbriimonadaceae bacterium]